MNWTIRAFYEDIGQIVVEYRGVTFAIDLPILDDGKFPEGEALNALIDSGLPTWHFDRLDRLKAGVPNSSAIRALVVPALPQSIPDDPNPVTSEFVYSFDTPTNREHIKDLIREVLAEQAA